jgi:hypothetical protein
MIPSVSATEFYLPGCNDTFVVGVNSEPMIQLTGVERITERLYKGNCNNNTAHIYSNDNSEADIVFTYNDSQNIERTERFEGASLDPEEIKRETFLFFSMMIPIIILLILLGAI